MHKYILHILLSSFFLLSSTVFAFQIDPVAIDSHATITSPNLDGFTRKKVKLMHFIFTDAELNAIKNKINSEIIIPTTDNLPSSTQLGMNNVPVLDQGDHGTCVTFAQTAALDAMIGKGDYISQLCTLELGTYLEKENYQLSGWYGTMGPSILALIERFGFVNKTNQHAGKCAGVKKYPLDENDEGKPLPFTDFIKVHENFGYTNADPNLHFNKWVWIPILNAWAHSLKESYKDPYYAEHALIAVKTALANNQRVTIGINLFGSDKCLDIGCATHKKFNDTFAMTPSIIKNPLFLGGHEMVITGYDDQAFANDGEGKRHIGLLTLRNSFGSNVGDNGDFYMSYEYFIKLVLEAQRIAVNG